jgi:hypothetical protein
LWRLFTSTTNPPTFFYGDPGDESFVGDWDCDGTETPGLYRRSDGFVYLRNSNTLGPADIQYFLGNEGDLPLAGDFNGDGCGTVSIYRPSIQTFFIINSLGANNGFVGAADTVYVFGDPDDKPFVGDFNGNGVETVGLHRESTGQVFIRQTHTQGAADLEFYFGNPDDRFVAGDWNANGIYSPGVFRPTDVTFYLRFTNTQGSADASTSFGGSASQLPVSGDLG